VNERARDVVMMSRAFSRMTARPIFRASYVYHAPGPDFYFLGFRSNEMSRISTQAWNALRRAGYEEPYSLPITTLISIPGIGPGAIAFFAEEAIKLRAKRML
jgi:hypothetical protein